MNSMPSDRSVLGDIPGDPGPLSDYNVRKDLWDDKKTEYDQEKEGGYFRHTFSRGPALNDTTVNRSDSRCLASFKNLDTENIGEWPPTVKLCGIIIIFLLIGFLDI